MCAGATPAGLGVAQQFGMQPALASSSGQWEAWCRLWSLNKATLLASPTACLSTCWSWKFFLCLSAWWSTFSPPRFSARITPQGSFPPNFLLTLGGVRCFCLQTRHFQLFTCMSPSGQVPYFFSSFLMAVLGLHCYAQAFSSCRERGLLFVAVCGLLIVVASFVVEHGL